MQNFQLTNKQLKEAETNKKFFIVSRSDFKDIGKNIILEDSRGRRKFYATVTGTVCGNKQNMQHLMQKADLPFKLPNWHQQVFYGLYISNLVTIKPQN